MNIKVILACVGFIIGVAIGMFVLSTSLEAITSANDPKDVWFSLLVGVITAALGHWLLELIDQTDVTFTFFAEGVITYVVVYTAIYSYHGVVFMILGIMAYSFAYKLITDTKPVQESSKETI